MTTTPSYLTDFLQRCHKVLVACYGKGQKHVECLETETAEIKVGKVEGVTIKKYASLLIDFTADMNWLNGAL